MKRIAKYFNRHPLVYFIRYILMSENFKGKEQGDVGCFHLDNNLSSIPQLYFEVNEQMNLEPFLDEYDKAIAIGTYLRSRMKGGPGIGLSSRKTLEKMLAQEGGVCSDFSQIFNIFCFINKIKVKEWGCIDRFYKTTYGHSFNEIYSSGRQKWIAVDIHKAIVFHDQKGILLSGTELFNTLRKGEPVQFVHYSDYVSPDHARTASVYATNTLPFVIGNNRIQDTDYYFEKYQDAWSPIVINILILLKGKNHKFLFVMDNYKKKLLSSFLQKEKQN